MNTVWREYGVIGVLLVVAISGYLFVSRHQEDLLALSLDAISSQLLALVPDEEGRGRVTEVLNRFKERVAAKEVDPDQVEQFAASVLNLGTAGEPLNADDAELVVRLALDENPALPLPDGITFDVNTSTPRKPARPPTADELAAVGERLQPMIAFFNSVRTELPTDTTMGVPFRFYADQGLHVVVDDRYREQIESAVEAKALMSERAVSWRARFADATEAERDRLDSRVSRIIHLRSGGVDSVKLAGSIENLARIRRLESLGVIAHPDLDSIMIKVETELMRVIADLPTPPSPPASGTTVVRSSVANPNG